LNLVVCPLPYGGTQEQLRGNSYAADESGRGLHPFLLIVSMSMVTVLIMLLWWMEQRALSFLLGGLVVFSLSLFLEAQVFNLRLYLGPLKLPCLSQERRGET
jgi:hypothetical protein